MVGTGGSALVAKTLGEGDVEMANRYFSMLVIFNFIGGIVLSSLGILFMQPIAYFLGATDAMIADCVVYGRTVLIFNTAFMLQNTFQTFLTTAEKPKLGLVITVVAGFTNMALDALFIVGFGWGVAGAAIATGISQCVGGLLPFIYFLRPNKSPLHLTGTKLQPRILVKACTNGASELMSSISSSVVSMLYNFQLLKFAGENGVVAYGVLMYIQFIFMAVFIGYTIGTAPIISYHFGAAHPSELKNMLCKSLSLVSLGGFLMMLAAQGLAMPLAKIFVGYDPELFHMTKHAFRLFSFSFILAGVNIFSSSFFTALNDGVVSAIISFFRTLVFQMISVLVLPRLFGLEGIWWAIIVAEAMACVVSIGFIVGLRRKYQYW